MGAGAGRNAGSGDQWWAVWGQVQARQIARRSSLRSDRIFSRRRMHNMHNTVGQMERRSSLRSDRVSVVQSLLTSDVIEVQQILEPAEPIRL